MFLIQNNFFKFKNVINIIKFNRHQNISSASLSEAREKFKILKNGCIHLEKEEESGIAIIKIDNPTKKNAISGLMATQLESIVDNLENWEAGKGVILTSVGDIFCAGTDLSYIKQFISMDGSLLSSYMQHILNKLYSLPLITVCLVHNRALGGGAELTTSTDYRLFSENGELIFTEGKVGMITAWGGGTRLVKSFGPRITLDLLCSGRSLKADEALKIGYADHLVTGEDQLLEAKQWLKQRLTHPPVIVQAMKKMVVGARDLNIVDSAKNETEIFSKLWGGPLNIQAFSSRLNHS